MSWIDWIAKLMPLFLDLVKTLAGDEYDEEQEKQAILAFNRQVADLRAARELS